MDARWRPWINALRRLAPQPVSQPNYGDTIAVAHETGVIWLPWRWSTRDDQAGETWRLTFEALELLAIAAHANQALWRKLMTQWCPHTALYWENSSSTRVFELGCEVRVAMTDILSPACERFVRDDIDSVVSDNYKQLRSDLQASLGVPTHPLRKIVARVRVVLDDGDFNATTETPEELSPLLFEVVQLVALQLTQENAPLPYTRKFPPLFRIEQVRAEAFFSYHMPNDLLYLHRIASCGVEVHTLQLNKLVLTQATAPQYTTMLQQMLAADVSESSRGCSPSRSVWLHRDATRQTYDGVFSALLHSTSIREFVQLIQDETLMEGGLPRTPARDRYWQWIAAAIFSSQATNPIDDVYFNFVEIEMEDANVLERTLQARNPLSELFPGCTKETNITSLSASRFRLSDDVNNGDPTSDLVLPTPVNYLQVLDATEDREWLRVLLPGWGQAWVKKEDARFVGNSPNGKVMGSASVRSIKRLRMDQPDWNTEAFMKILRAVGCGIQHLELSNWNDAASASSGWLTPILQACPSLGVLEMGSIPIQSLEMFARGYESGTCHMSRLAVRSAGIDDFDDNASRFFDYLADPNHAMAQHVRELAIDTRNARRVPAGLLLAIARMLASNKFISTLTVSVDIRSIVGPAEEDLLDQIAGYSGEPVSIRLGPLALKNKLAFLSAIWGRSDASVRLPQAIQAMDASAVGLIFQYAADCRKRKIDVSVKSR